MDEKIIENEIALYPVLSDKLVYLASGFKNINLHGENLIKAVLMF